MKVQLKAGKNATGKFRAYSLGTDGSLTPVGPVTTLSVDDEGNNADAMVPVEKLKEPTVGGKHFVVQLEDVNKGDALIPESGGKVGTFQVNSDRAQVTKVPQETLVPGKLYPISLDGGIPGDKYQMQVMVDGQWKNYTYEENATITERNIGTVSFVMPSLAIGDYKMRVRNVTKDQTVFEDVLKVGEGGTPSPKPTQPGTPKPSQPGKPKPSQPGNSGSSSHAGLPKTGV